MTVDLLDPVQNQRYSLRPELLIRDWESAPSKWILIDEIQKVPALLDVVHKQMKHKNVLFALTGSSARKLRRGASNLLGGRAHEFHMHPLTHVELKNSDVGFNLDRVLAYGSLPYIVLSSESSRIRSLYSYVSTYLKEEILVEQIIRKVEPFQKFLEVAAKMNGKILNFSKIARDSGVEERSVARYFQILDDTLVGFHLYPYERSIRRQQSQKAKFYYFRSKNDVEVDLIIIRPGLPDVLVEIKSKDYFDKDDFDKKEMYVLSRCLQSTLHKNVHFLYWEQGIKKIFDINL
jgi:predicted AAA+ superfamily ATPase